MSVNVRVTHKSCLWHFRDNKQKTLKPEFTAGVPRKEQVELKQHTLSGKGSKLGQTWPGRKNKAGQEVEKPNGEVEKPEGRL